MEQLAKRYAELKGTRVIDSWLHENSITFVLESGPKLTMSTRQLEEAIAELKAISLANRKEIIATTQEVTVSAQSAPSTSPPAGKSKKKGTPSE